MATVVGQNQRQYKVARHYVWRRKGAEMMGCDLMAEWKSTED